MLQLHGQLGIGKGENVHNPNEVALWSYMENCNANSKETRGELNFNVIIIYYPLLI